MIEFVASLPRFQQDLPVKNAREWFEQAFGDTEGVCYYKYPIVGVSGKPDLVFLLREYEPIVLKAFAYTCEQIKDVEEESWLIRVGKDDVEVDSPLLILDDLSTELRTRFEKVRQLRRRLAPQAVAAFPLCGEADFVGKFGGKFHPAVWAGGDKARDFVIKLDTPLSEFEWKLARAVLQTAIPLTRNPGAAVYQVDTIGAAVKMLDANIALLDEQQNKVAIQIPPGPQRIRGLAGTGKTVLLAMKAANIHHHFPDNKILLTFNTQSLYNQARNLVTRFYRFYSDVDPNWDVLHIRHAWGGRSRPGVYYDLTQRQGFEFLNFKEARARDAESAFRACCRSALQHRIEQEYDYILVDEAQDFPREFFPLLYRLCRPPHAIYWAYDELQSLVSLDMPDPKELFGVDDCGQPLVSLDIESDDDMERDLVLLKSYRCPLNVLMLAHGIGLGIHNPRGPVQMLGDENSWRAVGYVLETGTLTPGSEVTLYRPPENSPNQLVDIYQGKQRLVTRKAFESREGELEWIGQSIATDVKDEGVPPEQIVVITLDSLRARDYMVAIQEILQQQSIASTIPGLINDAAEFAEPGMVTLSTVFRAKGNEAAVVYIMGFESLYDFAEEIENRNRAFTAISRSKGWVRITGAGKRMLQVQKEIDQVLADIPRFRFKFPDMESIRKLDASETTRRRQTVRKAKEAVERLKSIDPAAFEEISEGDRNAIIKLLKKGKQ